MPEVTGRVLCISAGERVDSGSMREDFGAVAILERVTNTLEIFIIWFTPAEPSASTRIFHSMWLSLLRDALARGELVRIDTVDDDSAFIRDLRIGGLT